MLERLCSLSVVGITLRGPVRVIHVILAIPACPVRPKSGGKHRAILVCGNCAGGAIRLYGHYGNCACRFCHRAQYLSQKRKTAGRKRLSAAKLRLKLGGWPDIREPFPPRAKWKHKKRYQRLRNQAQELEAQANQTRFRKQIDLRTFAYHVA